MPKTNDAFRADVVKIHSNRRQSGVFPLEITIESFLSLNMMNNKKQLKFSKINIGSENKKSSNIIGRWNRHSTNNSNGAEQFSSPSLFVKLSSALASKWWWPRKNLCVQSHQGMISDTFDCTHAPRSGQLIKIKISLSLFLFSVQWFDRNNRWRLCNGFES